MQSITFITGNQKKADYLAKYLWFPIEHMKLDLDEIQSLDLREIVEHKVRQAYEKCGKPVLVEDTSLEFTALGRLPWTFIKFFLSELGLQKVCDLLSAERTSIARTTYWYYDGSRLEFLEWHLDGNISTSPRGKTGFAWDQIFIPHWSDRTSAELDDTEYERFYLEVKPLKKVREFLLTL